MNLVDFLVDHAELDGPIVRVHRVLNHRVDPDLLATIASNTLDLVPIGSFDVVVTAEASGIAPGVSVSMAAGTPLVFAKKWSAPPVGPVTTRLVHSPTKGGTTYLGVDTSVLDGSTSALIIDDFLSTGTNAEALGDLVMDCGIDIAAFVFVVEKAYLGGRRRLADRGWQVHSLAKVTAVEPGLEIGPGS